MGSKLIVIIGNAILGENGIVKKVDTERLLPKEIPKITNIIKIRGLFKTIANLKLLQIHQCLSACDILPMTRRVD
jgi:hypothetical protein